MLKMILADDEPIVRRGLRNSIPWNELGIEVVAEAVDGQEAFELCLKLEPDLLFTDIRMPLMDGLEVAMKLKEHGSPIRVIFISGIQDFNYAKTALDINAGGYILKPIKVNEVREVVTKVVNSMRMERNRELKNVELRQQLREYTSVAKEKFIRNLVAGYDFKQQEVMDKLEYFQLPVGIHDPLVIAVLQIDEYSRMIADKTEFDRQLLVFSVNNIAEEILDNHNAGITFYVNENEFILMLKDLGEDTKKYGEMFQEIVACMNKFLEIAVSIGIGRPVSSICGIRASYMDAMQAIQYKFYTGKNSILDITDISNITETFTGAEAVAGENLFELENKLIGLMRVGNKAGVGEIIENIFSWFMLSKEYPVEYIQSICVELVCIASRNMHGQDEWVRRILADRSPILERIYATENIFALKEYMNGLFTGIAQHFSQKYDQKNSKVISRIKEIIHKKYRENISVAAISEEVYLTPNYISLIFKQETGETITEYITKVRIEAAKELLETTDFKVLEVAEMVGYDNPHYFSKVFKKYTGVLPVKFRA